MTIDRRDFLKLGGITALAGGVPLLARAAEMPRPAPSTLAVGKADHQIRIGTGLLEIGPKRIISTTTYNGQFPGPLLRFKEGQKVVVDIHNDTDTPEQLHWHGQFVPDDVDGAAEERTPFIPAHGMRREVFVPGRRAFVSITPICARAAICRVLNTAARSGRFTSSRRTSRATTTARCFWCSRSRAVLQPGWRHGAGFPGAVESRPGTEGARRGGDEGLAGQGHEEGLRGRLSVLYHQRHDAGPR